MPASLSDDLRTRLIAAVEDGQSCRSAAKRFGVAASTAIKWVARWRADGKATAKPRGGDRHSHRMEAYADEILGLIDKTPDITLAEIAAYMNEAHGLRVAQSTIWRLLNRHRMTFKKNRARSRTTTARRLGRAAGLVRSSARP